MKDDLDDSMCHQPYGPSIPKGTRDAEMAQANKENPTDHGSKPEEPSVDVHNTDSKVIEVITVVAGHANKSDPYSHLDQSIMHPDIAVKTDLINSRMEGKVETEKL